VLTHEDGSTTALHPTWSNTKVNCYFDDQPEDDEVPATGLGGTSGPGTFRRLKQKNVDVILKFDHTKQPNRAPKAKAAPKGKAKQPPPPPPPQSRPPPQMRALTDMEDMFTGASSSQAAEQL
jgi:hypothetical protein